MLTAVYRSIKFKGPVGSLFGVQLAHGLRNAGMITLTSIKNASMLHDDAMTHPEG